MSTSVIEEWEWEQKVNVREDGFIFFLAFSCLFICRAEPFSSAEHSDPKRLPESSMSKPWSISPDLRTALSHTGTHVASRKYLKYTSMRECHFKLGSGSAVRSITCSSVKLTTDILVYDRIESIKAIPLRAIRMQLILVSCGEEKKKKKRSSHILCNLHFRCLFLWLHLRWLHCLLELLH